MYVLVCESVPLCVWVCLCLCFSLCIDPLNVNVSFLVECHITVTMRAKNLLIFQFYMVEEVLKTGEQGAEAYGSLQRILL